MLTMAAKPFLLFLAFGAICVSAVNYERSSLCPHMPRDFKFHRETERCYRVGGKGPCGALMRFTMENKDFGICDCDLSLRCGRPVIYDTRRRRCYFVYDQGPCRPGKWLVFGSDLKPVCRRNNCVDNEAQVPTSALTKHYWFTYKNQCYRTFTKGYCTGEDEILFNKDRDFRPTCVRKNETVCEPPITKTTDFQEAVCYPGQKKDVLGQCKRVYTLLTKIRDDDRPITVKKAKPYTEGGIHCLFCDLRSSIFFQKVVT